MVKQLSREVRQPPNLALGKSVFNDDIPSLNPTTLGQPLSERLEKTQCIRWISRAKKTYPVNRPRLLCHHNRRGNREAESKNDREPDQPHEHLGEGWLGESSRDAHAAGSSGRTIIAPHVHVIQTRSASTAASNSPQYSCSRMNVSSPSPREVVIVSLSVPRVSQRESRLAWPRCPRA